VGKSAQAPCPPLLSRIGEKCGHAANPLWRARPESNRGSRPHAASIFCTPLTRSRRWKGLERTLASLDAWESGLSATDPVEDLFASALYPRHDRRPRTEFCKIARSYPAREMAKCAGRQPNQLIKAADERVQAVVPHLEANLGDAEVRGDQQALSLLHAQCVMKPAGQTRWRRIC